MNPRRCNEQDYINFIVAAQYSYSCLEAGRVQPTQPKAPSHDSLTRMLHRNEPNTDDLYTEAQAHIDQKHGLLVIDDSTLDKPYSKHIELVYRHWSGKHHQTVKGINLLTLLWTDGDKNIPCDYRVYDKPHDGKTKNDHFIDVLEKASQRGFRPEYVCFDGWYSRLENLKQIRQLGWLWFTRLKSNRLLNPDDSENVPLARVEIGKQGRIVHLKGYGFIKVFRTIAKNGDGEHWATNDLKMNELGRLSLAEKSWGIEHYHRGLKQFCGVEKCQARSANAQRNHIGFAIRAFLRLEVHSYASGLSWFEQKMQIIREAIRCYLTNPVYIIGSTA